MHKVAPSFIYNMCIDVYHPEIGIHTCTMVYAQTLAYCLYTDPTRRRIRNINSPNTVYYIYIVCCVCGVHWAACTSLHTLYTYYILLCYIICTSVFVAYATRVNRHVLYILLLLSTLLYYIIIITMINTRGVCDNPRFDEQKRIIIIII